MPSFNLTVTDQSPVVLYSPEREGASTSGWTSNFSPEPSYDPTHTANNLASGVSSHTTTLSGASAQIDFVGTAISIYGQGTAGAYSTTLDGGSTVTGSPSGSLLASYGGLNDSVKHTILLKATKAQSLTLSYAEFTVRSDIASSSVVNTTQTAVTADANNTFTTNSFFSTSGTGISNLHEDSGYTRIDTDGSGATISFSCSNTSALFVYGTTNWNHQTYSIEVDPSAGASQGARIFNGTSKWFVLDNLIFFESGLDPSQTYQVKMTNLIEGSYSDIHSVVMMNLPPAANGATTTSGSSPSSTSSSSPSKASTVKKTAGIAIGAVAIVVVLVLVAFFCLRRRSRKHRKKERLSRGGLMVTPFEDHPQSTPPSSSLSSGSMAPMTLNKFGTTASDRYTYSSASTQDLRAPPPLHYSEVSGSPRTSADFDPYSDTHTMRPPHRPFASGASGASMTASGSASISSSQPASTSRTGGPISEKRSRPPSDDTASSRRVRQEVDAGRVLVHAEQEEETLPPTYDPNWSSA
ncbi:hypothetical protein C8F01DRAFT_1118339 [Mycena amicta]|nr:hypothetical protein C8F01DRAFT_1118339 [Mycena amicta]